MSTLTEEQRKRIEENRRKALEKRAFKSGSNQTGNNQVSTTPAIKSNISLPSCDAPVKPTDAPSTSKSRGTFSFLIDAQEKNGNKKLTQAQLLELFKANRDIRGYCILLSRKRFYINMEYHKEAIEIFKSVPSRLYDMQSKKWNFSIDDHEKLVSLFKPLQPKVILIPLPQTLLKIFKAAELTKQINEYDLSHMDQVLLDALLPFQKVGLYFGIQHGGRVLLADDMGLGKTIEGIAIANYFAKDWPLLVVTPSSVRYSWLDAFNMWLPSVEAHEISVINSGKDHIPDNKVIIMSYDLFAKMQTSIVKRKFKSVIFDESHFLKSHKTARTKAAQAVMKNMNRIVMLSGTPALSRPIELFTQVSALCPKYFHSFNQYGMRYCNGRSTPWGMDFSGSSNMGELQIVLEELVMIRRLKSDVIKQLPSKRRQMIVLDPNRVSTKSKVLRAMCQKMKQEHLKGSEKRGALLEYFHETGIVKIPAVCDYIEDLLESDKKFLCFAHHRNFIKNICNCVERKKIDYICIDGSVSSEQRKKLCDHFQLNDTCKVAVLSITAANCGITLTAASLVIFAELFWNPGILTQAEDRAHRIGQEDSVLVQYLVARGTADDEIWPLVQRKLEILNKAGLSKDNFKSADTIMKDGSSQPTLDECWNDLELSEISDFDDDIPEKRLKLEL